MLFVPFGALDYFPVDLLGYIAYMWKPNLVRYAIPIDVFIRIGAESNKIFLTEDFQ